MAGLDNSKARIDEVINNGSAYEILCKMIHEHGGLLKEIKLQPKEIESVKSSKEGYINFINTEQIGLALNALNIEKKGKDIIQDPQAGFKMLKKKGSFIKRGDSIAKIFSSNKEKLQIAKKIFENSIDIKNEKVIQDKLIIH